jgi:hypothetical protein
MKNSNAPTYAAMIRVSAPKQEVEEEEKGFTDKPSHNLIHLLSSRKNILTRSEDPDSFHPSAPDQPKKSEIEDLLALISFRNVTTLAIYLSNLPSISHTAPQLDHQPAPYPVARIQAVW